MTNSEPRARHRNAAVITPNDLAAEALVDAILLSSRALVALSARSIASAHGVTLPQFRMLVVLEAGPQNLSGLAAALNVAPSTATRMVDRLVEAGLLYRTIPAGNRREISLTLTAAGRHTVRTVTARRRRDLRRVIEQIPTDRREAVAKAMSDFAEAAESVLGPTRH